MGNDLALRRFRVGDCVVDRPSGRVTRTGAATHIEPRVMDVLVALANAGGNTVSRDDLIKSAWGHTCVTDEALSRCISLIRQALGDDCRAPRIIETIPKRGYRLLAAVETDAARPTHIAVLPFVNLSGDPAHEHLADGITELVITYIALMPALRVISRTSSMLYRDSRLRLSDIARELGVQRVIEGCVLVSRHSLQAVLQLIDPATDTHLLARTYTLPLADALDAQNDLATRMALAVGATVAS